MSEVRDPFQALGVTKTASQEEIKNAYRNLAKKYHPDLNPGNRSAEQRFKEVNAAYELIGSPEARKKFEQGQAEQEAAARSFRGQGPFYYQTQQGEGGGRYSRGFRFFDDLGGQGEMNFEDLFGGRFRQGSTDVPGQDETYPMEIGFDEAVLGGERDIVLPNGRKLRVKIPAGIETGKKLRFAGQGGAGIGNGSPGDAYIEIRVRPSEIFKRIGNNIVVEQAVSLDQAVLGGEVHVPTVGGSVLLKIPRHVNTGSKLRVRGRGVPDRTTGQRGDQIVELKVVLPEKIDPELERAIREWSQKKEAKAS